MGRVVIGAFLAAIVIFVWGAISWPVLQLYSGWAFKTLNNEEAVLQMLAADQNEAGAYPFPMWEHSDGMTAEAQQASKENWQERHRRGPTGLLIYQPQGVEPMQPAVMVRGFAMIFIGAVLLGVMMRGTCCGSYFGRAGFAIGAAVFAALITHGIMWNYFHMPTNYSAAMMMDVVIGWTLGGLVLAAFVKPCAAAKSAQSPA